MKLTAISLAMVCALAACSGNPFGTGSGGGDTWLRGHGGGTGTLAVPENLRGAARNQVQAVYVPGATPAQDRLQINVPFGGNPQVVPWTRRTDLDVPGYSAFVFQDDALDRSFVGFGARSSDGSVRAAVTGDGGQANRVLQGAIYQREGGFSAPTDAPTGMVSYAGTYVGVSNAPTLPVNPISPQPPSDPSLPGLGGARVTGQVFMNADFNAQGMTVEGAIYDRQLIELGVPLESVILVQTELAADGTFSGNAERPERYVLPSGLILSGADRTDIGDYGGVIGGSQAGSLAGVLVIGANGVYRTDVLDADGRPTVLDPAAVETGIFVIDRCDAANTHPICAYVN